MTVKRYELISIAGALQLQRYQYRDTESIICDFANKGTYVYVQS